ncbi:MAG TPA: carbon-nitrogen hydrolase family protein [Mycobacteriales bacterium]|nr:carbon-nitrogen hydrolase family protein [Mycobacteriales bacterium]
MAVGQFAGSTDKSANLEAISAAVEAAAAGGAELVLLPEYSMYFDPDPAADLTPTSEPLDGEFARAVGSIAGKYGVTLIAGMNERLAGETRISNTLIAYGPDGQGLGSYRKLHLYDAFGVAESEHIRPGEHAAPLLVEVGGLRFGAMTCYDLRFPEAARALLDAGADALLVPAAWAAGPAKEDHWRTLIRARAIENTAYVLAAGLTGPKCSGQSMIVDPMGVVIAGAGEAPGVATAVISAERLAAVRQKLPSLQHRRFGVVPR